MTWLTRHKLCLQPCSIFAEHIGWLRLQILWSPNINYSSNTMINKYLENTQSPNNKYSANSVVSKTNTQQKLQSSNSKYSNNSVPKKPNKSASTMITKYEIVTKYYGHQIPNTKYHGHQIPDTHQIIQSPNTKYSANTIVTKINTHQILWSPNTKQVLWSLNTLKKCASVTRDNSQKSAQITILLVKFINFEADLLLLLGLN